MSYITAGITDIGRVRKVNQDRMLIRVDEERPQRDALLVVADGMGGLACGEKASALAVRALAAWWNERDAAATREETSQALDKAICEAHRQIYYLGETLNDRTGSTLSVLYFRGSHYLIKQVGDSRIYEIDGRELRQLTTDQTWCNQKIQSGELTPEQANTHPMRHALVNALGVSAELAIDTAAGSTQAGRSYLLCSDGFYSEAPLQAPALYRPQQAPAAVLAAMMEELLQGPARDNATAVLCRIG